MKSGAQSSFQAKGIKQIIDSLSLEELSHKEDF